MVQTGLNDDPTDGSEQNCETFHFAVHDAMFNVIGLTDAGEENGTGPIKWLSNLPTFGPVPFSSPGIVIPMNGATNIPGSEHHLFHQSLEEFWRPFRDPGVAPPTNAQYDSALRAAMNHAGMSAENVEFFATQARRQRLLYGLNDGAPVPNVPGPIPGY